MNKLTSIVSAAAMAVALMGTGLTAASAQTIQFGISSGANSSRGSDEGRFERRGNDAYYNGQRGYRERRSGYRQYNGFWFPSQAFSFGITIGGGNRGRDSIRLSARHIEWCEDHYRSYRISDNSFQPRRGRRQQCDSPYFR